MKIQVPEVWGAFSVMHSTVSATIIWCSSCATVGTGTQETGENADIWATVTAASNTLSFVSKKKVQSNGNY